MSGTGTNPSLIVQDGAQVLSLAAAAGRLETATVMFTRLNGNINNAPASAPLLNGLLKLGTGPVLNYDMVDNGGGSSELTTTRNTVASAFVGGNAGHFVGQLENALNGKSLPELSGSLLPCCPAYLHRQPANSRGRAGRSIERDA